MLVLRVVAALLMLLLAVSCFAGHVRFLLHGNQLHQQSDGIASITKSMDAHDDLEAEHIMFKGRQSQRMGGVYSTTEPNQDDGPAVSPQAGRPQQHAAGCEDLGKLKQIVLAVHCRNSKTVCTLRKPLLMSYAPHFREVLWLVDWPHWERLSEPPGEVLCEQGDPHLCVARLLNESLRRSTSAGVLYMHFDAVLHPCAFSRILDTRQLGYFNKKMVETKSCQQMDECNTLGHKPSCNWAYWDQEGSHKVRDGWLSALADIREQFGVRLATGVLGPVEVSVFQTVWMGMDDFFYVPRAAYSDYTDLALALDRHNIFHEIAGPAIIFFAHRLTGIAIQDFKCWGGTNFPVEVQDIKSPEFVCGHQFDYAQGKGGEALASMLKLAE